MSRIQKLTPELIKKIAAGEVVERPASALKELLENSIDASSTDITVKIEEGGSKKIQVIDNGNGIHEDDLRLVFELHSTSKLKSEADLNSIITLGFRGEALATISSVSESVVLSTKTNSQDFGNKVVKKSGDSIQITKVGNVTNGTSIEVNGLFEPIPARKKFLKSNATETKHLTDTFINTLFPYLHIHSEIFIDGKLSQRLTKTTDLKTRVFETFGNELSENLIYLENYGKVTGFIAQPEKARKFPKAQQIYINNRFVKSSLIHKAVQQAYQGFIHRDLKPDYFINITLDPEIIDINVHPRKLEVKFTSEQEIFSLVYRSIQKALNNHAKSGLELISSSIKNNNKNDFYNSEPSREQSSKPTYKNSLISRSSHPSSKFQEAMQFNKSIFSSNEIFSQDKIEDNSDNHYSTSSDSSALNVMQVMNTYILFEVDNQLLLIDQHAAAEKILFEKLMKDIDKISRKPLLVPEVIEFRNSTDKNNILQQSDLLNSLGYIIEDFGGNTIQVTEIPELATISGVQDIITDFLKNEADLDIDYNESHFSQYKISKDIYLKIATTACHSAIRAGQKLSKAEMMQIINDVTQLEDQPFCPHGRPIFIKLKKSHIDELFQRNL